MSDLIISDTEYEDFASKAKNTSAIAEEQLSEYMDILKTILDNAVTHGNIYNCLTLFYEKATKLQEFVKPLGVDLNTSATEYLAEIDNEDQYLY